MKQGLKTAPERRGSPVDCTDIALDLHGIDVMPLVWGGYIIRPADTKYSNVYDAPNAPGIYGWYTSKGDLMYIGRSVAIQTRLRQHERQTVFWGGSPTYYSYKLVPECALLPVEVAHIKALQPVENQFLEAGYPSVQDQMIPAIKQVWGDELPRQKARLESQYRALAEQIASRL